MDDEETSTYLKQVIDWLRDGYMVVLETEVDSKIHQEVYHDCEKNSTKDKKILKVNPHLLFHDEWPWHLSNEGFQKCQCH